jgi:hypothetical protein
LRDDDVPVVRDDRDGTTRIGIEPGDKLTERTRGVVLAVNVIGHRGTGCDGSERDVTGIYIDRTVLSVVDSLSRWNDFVLRVDQIREIVIVFVGLIQIVSCLVWSAVDLVIEPFSSKRCANLS